MNIKEARQYAEALAGPRTLREAEWRELSRWLIGYRGVFSGLAQDETGLRDQDLFRNIAQTACLKAASGMTSGMTPRNVSWFRPAFTDPALTEASGARAWLDRLDLKMKDCLARGGFYQAIQAFNLDLIWSGCALLYCERGTMELLRFECCQVGTFAIARDHENRLEAVSRRLRMTARAMADVFGQDKLAPSTRDKLAKNPHEEIDVTHLVHRARDGRYPFASLYYEDGGEDFLRKSGFNEMPFFHTVWHEGTTPYGMGPGDECLADARQLDLLERRKLAALGKLIDPPVIVDNANLKDALDLAPGGINYISNAHQIIPIFDLAPTAAALARLPEEIATVSKRLADGLMATVFDSIPLDQRPRDMSATEYLERKREAMQILGPVISAYEPDVLDPILARVLATLDRSGNMPVIPLSLQGIKNIYMKMDFISPMANALRQTSAEATRGLVSDVMNIMQGFGQQEIIDKLDLDQVIDELASGIGAPGSIVRADDDVAQIRQQRAQIQARQAQMQQAAQAMALTQQAQQIGAAQQAMQNQSQGQG